MVSVTLEPPCPKASSIVSSIDPVPWTLDDILSELHSIDVKLGLAVAAPSPLKQPPTPMDTERASAYAASAKSKPFVIGVSEDDEMDLEEEEEEDGHGAGTRFSCADIDFSDSEESEDEFNTIQPCLMKKKTLEEGILSELELEDQLKVKVKAYFIDDK